MVKVLVLGQTPPPFGGQALAIGSLLEGEYKRVELYHVRMHFSRTLGETGRFSVRKVLHLVSVVTSAVWVALVKKVDVIHYPPSNGKELFPFCRDALMLFVLRLLRKKTVLVFHAAGLSDYAPKRLNGNSGVKGWVLRRSFFGVDAAVQTSQFSTPDGQYVNAGKTFIIANGVRDEFTLFGNAPRNMEKDVVQVLYVGLIGPDKGITTLLEAASALNAERLPFRVVCVGEFVSSSYRDFVFRFLESNGLTGSFLFPGVLVGEKKWKTFGESDVFCYPSFAPFESFGIVVVEAMMFRLPVVGTKWRGIQGIIEDGATGFVVPVKDHRSLADKLRILITSPRLREEMGERGRERFLKEYSVEKMRAAYEDMFVDTFGRG